MQGVPVGGDARIMFLVTRAMVDQGDVFIPADAPVPKTPAPGGRFTSKYGVGQSLVEIPLYVAGAKIARAAGVAGTPYGECLVYLITCFTSPLLAALWVVCVFWLGGVLGYPRGVSLGAAVLAGAATMILPHSKALFSEPLQGLSLTLACLAAVKTADGGAARGRARWAAVCGAALGALALTKAINVLILPAFCIYIVIKWSRRRPGAGEAAGVIVAAAIPLLAAFAGMLLFNHARFGEPMNFGYFAIRDRDSLYRFTVPFWSGLFGLIASTGKGVLFYVPLVWLLPFGAAAFARRRRDEAVLFALVTLVFLGAYSTWNQWHGDYAWGPRFLAPLMGLAALAAAGFFLEPRRGAAKLAAGAVIALSVFTQILGTAINFNEYVEFTKKQIPYGVLFQPGRVELRDDLLLPHFVPEFSPIAGHWWLLKNAVMGGDHDEKLARMQKDFPWKSLAPYVAPADPTSGARLDFWWLYLRDFFPESRGWTPVAVGLLAAVCALSGAALALRARRE